MTNRVSILFASALFIAASALTPANAQGLLGKVTSTVTNLVTGGENQGGGANVGGIVSLNDDDDGALLNLDLGGGDGGTTVAGVSAGGVGGLKVGGGSGQGGLLNSGGVLGTGLLDGDDDGGALGSGLLANTSVGLDLDGLGLDLDVGIGAPGPNGPAPAGDGQVILVGSVRGDGVFVVNCTVNNTRQVLQIAAGGKITEAEFKAWQRSANVQIVPIKLCPAARKQVAAIFAKSQKINLLQRAAMSDTLIAASLGRTRYDAGDVAAVERKGGQLVVYVF